MDEKSKNETGVGYKQSAPEVHYFTQKGYKRLTLSFPFLLCTWACRSLSVLAQLFRKKQKPA